MLIHKKGFTLVELLVVIAIIGILIALLLPAVQAARAAARRSTCANNMKQLGLALHMHHDTHNRLPAGWTGHDPANGQPHWFGLPGWAWAAHLLPFLEQGAIHDDLIDFDHPIWDPVNETVRTMAIATFRCPSDPGPDTFTLQSGGLTVGGSSPTPIELSRGNYVGVFGTFDLHEVCPGGACQGNGTFFLNEGVRFRDIRDGLSKTMVVGERWSKLGASTWVGVVTGGEHAPARVVGIAGHAEGTGSHAEDHFHNFSSYHAGGKHFLAADGSVHFITDDLDEATYQALCTRAEGDDTSGFTTR